MGTLGPVWIRTVSRTLLLHHTGPTYDARSRHGVIHPGSDDGSWFPHPDRSIEDVDHLRGRGCLYHQRHGRMRGDVDGGRGLRDFLGGVG